jgi:hypothetical protein
MDTIDGETWTPVLELPQTEVITWNEGIPPDGEIVLAQFRGEEGFTLAMFVPDVTAYVVGGGLRKKGTRFHDGAFEDVDTAELVCWALPKGPR